METVPPNHRPVFQISDTFTGNYPKIAKYFNDWDAQTTKELFLKFEQMIDFLRSQYNIWTIKEKQIFAEWDKNMTKGHRLSRKLQYLKHTLNVPFRVVDDITHAEFYKKFWEKNLKMVKHFQNIYDAEEYVEFAFEKEAFMRDFYIKWKVKGFDKY